MINKIHPSIHPPTIKRLDFGLFVSPGLEGKITVDDKAWVYGNGKYMGNDNGRWNVMQR